MDGRVRENQAVGYSEGPFWKMLHSTDLVARQKFAILFKHTIDVNK